MQKKTMAELGRLDAADATSAHKIPVVVILDNVRSMNNVGSVFRTCDGFAVQHLYLTGVCPQPPHRDITKTALGATETVPWTYAPDAMLLLEKLKQHGFTCIAIEQVHNSIALQQYNISPLPAKYALIFGNEVEGVQQALINQCDACLEIPQGGAKHSFNISVSVGIVLWQFYQFFIPKY